MKRTPRTRVEALRHEWHQQPQWAARAPSQEDLESAAQRPQRSGIDEALRLEAQRARSVFMDRNNYDPLRRL